MATPKLFGCISILSLSFYIIVIMLVFPASSAQSNTTKCQQVYITNTARPVYINSPNYKVYFRNDTDTCWTVLVRDFGNYVISVSAVYFRLQPYDDPTCRGHLEIRDGCTSISPLLGRYCQPPVPTVTSTGCAYLGFKATGVATGDKGFQLKVQVFQKAKVIVNPSVDSNCIPLSLVSPSVLYYLSSPGYPYRYLSDVDSCWTLSLADSLRGKYYIRFHVLNSQLEDSSDCHKDSIEVKDGDSSSAETLVTWCGSKTPYNVTSCGDDLYIRFRSDSSVQGLGYNAVYDAVPRGPNVACGYPEEYGK